ncbi:MAG: VanZ family protein [Nitrospira sp.]|nr:VanZ family protein [bacterium]MBL7049845.1 VanZ family protein [Nitrospira sp.]
MNKRNAVLWWGASVAYMFLIYFLSSHRLPDIEAGMDFDKVLHVGAYFVMAFLLFNALQNSGAGRFAFAGAILLTLLYGVSDEFHQSFVPGRHASFYDVVADLVGAIIGSIVANARKA